MKYFTFKRILFMRWALLLIAILGMATEVLAAPRPMSVSCKAPYPEKQRDLKRPRGDSDIWVFSLSLSGGARFVSGPYWSYPGKGASDPDWGTWSSGQDGSSSLSWASPQKTGSFSVRVSGQIVCGDGGGGAPIDFEAGWDGEVVAKEWKADPAIEGGEVTQPADTDEENPQEVGPGEIVNLAVSEAADMDTWTEGEETGQEADTVHYKWTSSNGGFVTNEHPNGDATEVKERTAQWKAPEEPGDYMVICEIDDEPATVEDPDTGDRDDDPVTRTVHIKVVVGESSATLKLYKDAELTEEATGTIGGSVYLVLEVKLGKYQKLVSNNATLRIEENYEEHSEAERRWDRSVNFGSGWQKKDANDQWQATTETPQSKNTSGDDQYFRKVWSWATYSQPLGHNEQHTVEIVKVDDGKDTELSFTPTNEGDDGKDGPEPVNADVANLVITEAKSGDGSEDYVIYDPNNEDHAAPTVNFKFEDEGGFQEGDEYRWTVVLFETDDQANDLVTGIETEPGSVAVEISALYAGVYGFDVWIQHYRNGVPLEAIGYKSVVVKFDDDQLTVNSNEQFEFQYHIMPASPEMDINDLSEVEIRMIDGNWSEDTQTNGPKTLNPLPAPAHVVTLTDPTSEEPGEGRIILTGVDGEGIRYRDHENKRLYPLNQKKPLGYRMLVGWGPKLASVIDGGSLSTKSRLSFSFSDGSSAFLYTLPLNTNKAPADIWNEIAQIKVSSRSGGKKFRSVLITTSAHSSSGSHIISIPRGGRRPLGAENPPFWAGFVTGSGYPTGFSYTYKGQNYTTTIADYSITENAPTNIPGISSYNMMGCHTSEGAAPDGEHLANNDASIAQVLTTKRGAGNSMGYKTLTYSKASLPIWGSINPKQFWFDALYSPQSISQPDALASGNTAEFYYLQKLGNFKEKCINPDSSANWGWDTWVVTNTRPLLDR